MHDHGTMVRYGLACLSFLAGCGEPGTRIVVVSWDEPSLHYVLRAEDFETLTDTRRLDGAVTEVIGGAELVVDEHVLAARTLDEQIDRAIREEGNSVKFSAVEGDDGWVPSDFDSLMMASIYRNVERAVQGFAALGVPFEELGKIRTYYLLRFAIQLPGTSAEELVDNAAYSLIPGLDGFFIVKQRLLDDLPLGMNLGVMAHEYTHAVTSRFRYGVPPVFDPGSLINLPCSAAMMDEGSSDYFAFWMTRDPAFMTHSVPARFVDRDLSRSRSLTEGEGEQSETPCGAVDPHLVGAKWAAALWTIGEEIGHDTLGPALVEALREFGDVFNPALATLPELLVRRLGDQDAQAACAVMAERFAPVAAQIGSCVTGP